MSTSNRKKEERIKKLQTASKLRKYEQHRSVVTSCKREFTEYVLPEKFRRGEGVEYKSLNSGEYNTFRNDTQRYTGTLVKGIATMHKSNAVPVIDEEHIIDIAHMRR